MIIYLSFEVLQSALNRVGGPPSEGRNPRVVAASNKISDIRKSGQVDEKKVIESLREVGAPELYSILREVLRFNQKENRDVAVLIASEYEALQLSTNSLIHLFEGLKSSEVLFYFLRSVLNGSQDPEVINSALNRRIKSSFVKRCIKEYHSLGDQVIVTEGKCGNSCVKASLASFRSI